MPERTLDEALRLEEPTARLADSYSDLVGEFSECGESLVPFPLSFPHHDFSIFLERLSACARGEGLPPGFVAHSTYWLVLGGREVVGVSNLRHQLTDALRHVGGHIGYGVRPSARGRGFATRLLRETLIRAAGRGLSRVLLTCDKTNLPSVRTILRNGGKLVSEGGLAPDEGDLRRAGVLGAYQRGADGIGLGIGTACAQISLGAEDAAVVTGEP